MNIESLFLENIEPLIKLAIAMLLGSIIGSEREFAGKTAGMRTHALVSMGATLFVIISIMVTAQFESSTVFDPLRVAAHIIVGVGFIGGGTIFMNKDKLSGITTAAGLWVAAGIGMATGFGLYILAVIVTLLTLFIFVILKYIEKLMHK
ncbi:MgtC/SapB family protein [Candidatus Amoebophilus asiaticus]|nr:MgtC/SapB family protein [Candidatus Amoebophilus asiaticus]